MSLDVHWPDTWPCPGGGHLLPQCHQENHPEKKIKILVKNVFYAHYAIGT
jgi:hypothetical protein